MKMLYGTLIGVVTVLVLMVAPLAVAKPPSWDKQINSPGRFQVLGDFAGAAVFDKETGLVWEQSPSTTTFTWIGAQINCNQRTTGGRLGWRLPTVQELASLVDPNNPDGNPDLPPGHPFSNVGSINYWSATTNADVTGNAWLVNFANGDVVTGDKTGTRRIWCVRGGQGVDPQ